jgi:sugar phosphate isomerase/epimerase
VLTRRQLLAGLAAGASARLANAAQARTGAMLPRITPAVCLYSTVLVKVGYIDLPMIVQALGFDGVDLSVEADGHVVPEKAPNQLMPALEACTGIGLDVPMITTGLTKAQEKDAQEVLGLATYIGVPYFRPGHWKCTGSVQIEMQLPYVQRDIANMAQLGRYTKMAMGVHNYMDGTEGAAVADINRVIRPIDPQWVGYDFDVAYAIREGGDAGFDGPLAVALPRLKMVTVRDFKWTQAEGGPRVAKPCPLGDGVVDFAKLFAALAKARFAGPVTLPVDHSPAGELDAVKHDLAFVRKQIKAAYGG